MNNIDKNDIKVITAIYDNATKFCWKNYGVDKYEGTYKHYSVIVSYSSASNEYWCQINNGTIMNELHYYEDNDYNTSSRIIMNLYFKVKSYFEEIAINQMYDELIEDLSE